LIDSWRVRKQPIYDVLSCNKEVECGIRVLWGGTNPFKIVGKLRYQISWLL